MSEIHDFDNEQQTNPSTLDSEVEMIVVNHHLLRKDQLDILGRCLDLYRAPEEVNYGADFDIREEINSQIGLVRMMRRNITTETGRLKTDTATRDIKEVIAAGTTLTTLLMKSHEQILNADRQRAIERAMNDAVKTLDKEAQDVFFNKLEELFELIE